MKYFKRKVVKIWEKSSAMEKLKLLTNLDLKLSTDILPSRRELHSLIVRGKKENLK